MPDLKATTKGLQMTVEATLGDRVAQAVTTPGNRLNTRYAEPGNLQDVEGAIARSEAALEAISEGHPDRAAMLNNLGVHLSCQYARTGNLLDLEAAIARLEAAVEVAPLDHPDRAGWLSNLGSNLRSRYLRTGNLQDLEAAITRAEAAVGAILESHPDRAVLLTSLGNNLSSRYDRTGNLQDLEAAIARSEAAVEVAPEDHPTRADLLSNLGAHLSRRYARTGDLRDLEAAIARSEAAVEATSDGHGDRAALLSNLGIRLSSRYARTGNVEDLEAATARLEAAVEATPQGHPARAIRLNNLASNLQTRYQRTGNLQDLEAAITRSEAAVEAIPEDHPTQAALLTNLGSQLNCRYERIGNLQDLEAAIARTEAALARTPEDHPNRVSLWNNLGIFLGSRYARTGNLPDLEVSITRSTAALEVTPETHPDRARRLTNLGNRLSMQYQRTRNPQDLEAAISRSEAAVEATPEVHPDRAGRLINLGNMLGMQYQRTRNLQDLEAAIATSEAAVKATPEGHPNQAKCLNCLGLYLSNRYERTGNMQDSTAAISAYLASWSTRTAPILTRLEAALNAAKILVFNPSVKDLPRASSLLSDAIHLMPLVTSRSLVREDQQHILGQLTGLASLAVAVSLEVGQSPLEALRLQELGRNITNGQLIDYRSEIWDLIEQHPMLAEDFDSLRQELDSPLPATKSSDMSANQYLQTLEASICRRNKVAQDLDDLILKIRQKPGFENFLLAVSTESLLLAADKGPIVVLNITELRSDAILLTKAHVTSIALTNASHAAMIKYFGIDAVTDNNKVKRELLEWLWKGIVQPVLRELGFYPAPKDLNSGAAGVDVLPRIWWVGVGLMAKAPIHAAAKFKNGRIQTTTIQYCLPSYTSTIKALQYSRSRQRQQRQSASAVIVTMPTTPGASSLPGVIKESDDIKRSLGDFTVDILERPTAECVLQALPNYSIAHFACHGVSSVNPAESHLLLTKKSVLHEEVDKLCVKDVAALKLPAARLAYLSACSTANTTSPKLVDEVTHIVSSFHIAGFIHVIGTLWHSEDQACQKMAVDFYAILNKTDNVAVSYRTALMGLMKQKPLQPMYWAPFIHFGA